MRDILAERNRGALLRFTGARTLLGFDFDGTLVPLVSDPDRARLRPRTRRLLRALAMRRPCVVVSGRALLDLGPRLRGTGVAMVVGNHGLEPFGASPAAARRVRSWLPVLHRRFGAVPGVVIEDKGYSLAVHYRKARDKASIARAVERAARALGTARVVPGKQVVNLVPPTGPHKGEALERTRRQLGCLRALFVGDDDTDEDVFRRAEPGRMLTVRVGWSGASSAHYFVKTQAHVDSLLELLLRGPAQEPRAARGPGPRARETLC